MDPKRQEEERKRIMQKYGVPEKKKELSNQTSRYLEYRNQEKEREERIKNPEKFETRPEEKIEVISEPKIEPIEEPKKKSWFSKLFK